MYGLSLGVQRMSETLPLPVYALLSGLNASTVGIIALAAVQLAEKAIKDKLTRILVIFGACAGLCYNALWYFPVLMLIGGLACVIWDGWISQKIGKIKAAWTRKRDSQENRVEEAGVSDSVRLEERLDEQTIVQKRTGSTGTAKSNREVSAPQEVSPVRSSAQQGVAGADDNLDHVIRIKVGIAITIIFFGNKHYAMLMHSIRLI